MKIEEINPFEIVKMLKQKKEWEEKQLIPQHRLTKKLLRELRKEAKAVGWKIKGMKGTDGKFHVYACKGENRRQLT